MTIAKEDLLREFETRYIPEPNSGCWLWTGTLTIIVLKVRSHVITG
jgi:hypothetical protein